MSARKAKKPWLRLEGRTKVPQTGVINVDIPDDEKVVAKEVPAKVDGVVVGTAQIYEDGTTSVIIDNDAPQWAKDKIYNTAGEVGYYSIGR